MRFCFNFFLAFRANFFFSNPDFIFPNWSGLAKVFALQHYGSGYMNLFCIFFCSSLYDGRGISVNKLITSNDWIVVNNEM
jgi:hypothetical protein